MTATITTTDTMTPYAAAKLVNKSLEELGLPTIPAQMIYNYTKSGRIPTVEVDGKKLVTMIDMAAWFNKYLQRKADKAAKVTKAIAAVTSGASVVDENQTALF